MEQGTRYALAYKYTFDVGRMLARGLREWDGWSLWKRLVVIEVLFVLFAASAAAIDGKLQSITALCGDNRGNAIIVLLASAATLVAIVVLIDLLFDRVIHKLVFKRSSVADADVKIAIKDHGVNCERTGVASTVTWSSIKQLAILKDRTASILWFGKREGLPCQRMLLPVCKTSMPHPNL